MTILLDKYNQTLMVRTHWDYMSFENMSKMMIDVTELELLVVPVNDGLTRYHPSSCTSFYFSFCKTLMIRHIHFSMCYSVWNELLMCKKNYLSIIKYHLPQMVIVNIVSAYVKVG